MNQTKLAWEGRRPRNGVNSAEERDATGEVRAGRQNAAEVSETAAIARDYISEAQSVQVYFRSGRQGAGGAGAVLLLPRPPGPQRLAVGVHRHVVRVEDAGVAAAAAAGVSGGSGIGS